jgi:hypothetical protein
MKRLLFIAIIALLSACGGKRVVDADLEPYVERFEGLYGSKVDYTVKFDSLSGTNYVGVCTINGFSKLVQIDPTYWQNLTDLQKEQLVFHELGHCSVYRGHNNAVDANNMPASIMRSYAFNTYEIAYYLTNMQSYYNELFHHTTQDTALVKTPVSDGDFIVK